MRARQCGETRLISFDLADSVSYASLGSRTLVETVGVSLVGSSRCVFNSSQFLQSAGYISILFGSFQGTCSISIPYYLGRSHLEG